jgi:cell division protein FtsW (lipid II flippase)
MSIVLLVFAFVLFAIAAIWNPQPQPSPWFGRLIAAGLAFWVASALFSGILPLHLGMGH